MGQGEREASAATGEERADLARGLGARGTLL